MTGDSRFNEMGGQHRAASLAQAHSQIKKGHQGHFGKKLCMTRLGRNMRGAAMIEGGSFNPLKRTPSLMIL